jgi:lon-related putative ATP-dependent protease
MDQKGTAHTMDRIRELDADALCQRCDPEQFTFQTTEELEDLADIIGQPRAVQAVEFGTGIQHSGYNIFAMGATGTGKRSLVLQYFTQVAGDKSVPSDWCYVNNFDQAHQPRALRLPPGMGTSLQKDIDELIEDLQSVLSSAFESEEYRTHRQDIEEETSNWQQQEFEELEAKAKQKSLAVMRTPTGFAFAPLHGEKVLSPDDFKRLPEQERERIQQAVEELEKELERIVLQQPRVRRELRDKVTQLDRGVADSAIRGPINDLRQKYAECPDVVSYLDALRKDVLDNVKHFLPDDQPSEDPAVPPWIDAAFSQMSVSFFQRYKVNLIINNHDLQGAPVVYEDNPTYQNLIGRVEYLAQMGALTTDFTLIKPGALHRANGGYLVLEARKVLVQPFAWEGLKRALHSGSIRIESPQQMSGLISTVSLEPEPIPLNVKVAMLGDRSLYYLLESVEPEFSELFKVVADFDELLERSTENQLLYARLIATLARKDGLRPFHRSAIARVIEQSSRIAEDTEKLTTHVRGVADLLHEADYWAGEADREVVTAEDVQRTIEAQIYRMDRIRERMLETTLRGVILIDTEGQTIGQVNGLSVVQLGDFSFGHPSRITARVRLGSGEVVDIEREVELSGPIHSKGVLILSGFLGARYATDHPLSLSASLVFEQSYGGVEGDSASSAELYTLLSAIAQVPIKQSLAVTGSVNQHGHVQAIGGVNEKIEGFFDVCKNRNLTGEQGVLIPSSNVKNLMLRHDVIEAVRAGQFHIYPVETIDQGIEILTGVPAGEADAEGHYPEDSINGKVQARLADLARQRAAFKATSD